MFLGFSFQRGTARAKEWRGDPEERKNYGDVKHCRKIKNPKKAKKSETLLTKGKKSSIIFGLSRREGREKPEKAEKIKKINFFLKKA